MKIKEKIILIFLTFLIFLLLFNIQSFAGSQNWNALDYDVTVNPDGSMDVVETWDITISETNTLFKDFDIDISKYSEISDIDVALVSGDEEILLEQIYEEQYHVDSGCYYALPIDEETFEIAWNVGLDNSTATRTYKIYYTIKDAIKVYNDCTELYWMFLNTENSIPGKNVTGTIKLPKAVTDIEKLRVWAHGDLSGNIERTSNDTVSFSIDKLNAGTRLEVRIVTEENIYESVTNVIGQNKLEEILSEEAKWANQANFVRNIIKYIVFIAISVDAIGVFIIILKIKKTKEEGKRIEEEYGAPEYDIEYFREIPNEKMATPARASYLNFVASSNTFREQNANLSNIFSATMLDFCLKGLIEFEPIDEKDIRIILKRENLTSAEFSEDEKIVYDILKDAIGNNDSITTKEFSKYSKKNYEEVYTKLSKIENIVEENLILNNDINSERKKLVTKMNTKHIINFVILFFVFIIGMALPFLLAFFPIYVGCIILFIYKGKNINKISILSEKGYMESKEWRGLQKYMEDYSLLKEKRVPDIVLWEKFLVYATTFGISKKVIKELKVVHPEMFDANANTGMYVGRYTYWNMVCSNSYGTSFDTINNSLSHICSNAISAYSSAHSSSSGGGGGFSGGGGGRRRRWRLRRSLNLK